MAKVYDLTTGSKIADLFSSVKQSDYILNKATFSMDDNLVLNDGVVWDLRSSGSVEHFRKGLSNLQTTVGGVSHRPIHKIDKFQDLVSGVFHPNGLEVIVGSAVWDMRTWRLLHTVQALDRMEARFTENADAIYAGIFGPDYDDVLEELGANKLAMQSMFRTVDALDYSLIASVDVKHRIEQLALDFTDDTWEVNSHGNGSSSDSSWETEEEVEVPPDEVPENNQGDRGDGGHGGAAGVGDHTSNTDV
ncbi:unnamed protein product [Dibothriocephalus latus]|uniref:Uncharacterized protein n=1 Tax=Dibothriocephalus latus TaxID=60516 RepID=A0A3P7MDY2_DIBLA|nr:unnamed protein product [Dibothriocephalus latus]